MPRHVATRVQVIRGVYVRVDAKTSHHLRELRGTAATARREGRQPSSNGNNAATSYAHQPSSTLGSSSRLVLHCKVFNIIDQSSTDTATTTSWIYE